MTWANLFVIKKPLNLHWAFAHYQSPRRVRSISYRRYIHISSRSEKTVVSHDRGKGTVDCTSVGLMIQRTEMWMKHEVWKTLIVDQLCSEVVHLASKAFIGNK